MRGLYLVLQVQELGLRVAVALTMVNEAQRAAPSARKLSAALGCPVVELDGRRRRGIPELRAMIGQKLGEATPDAPAPEPVWRWQPSDELAGHIERVRAALPADWPQSPAMALWALVSVGDGDELRGVPEPVRRAVAKSVPDGGRAAGGWIDDEVVGARYRWLDGEVASLCHGAPDRSFTERVDRILLHRVAGFAVFLAIMFVVFQSLFTWADPAISLIEACFAWLGDRTREVVPPGIMADFLVGGVIAGFGSVVVFLPQSCSCSSSSGSWSHPRAAKRTSAPMTVLSGIDHSGITVASVACGARLLPRPARDCV